MDAKSNLTVLPVTRALTCTCDVGVSPFGDIYSLPEWISPHYLHTRHPPHIIRDACSTSLCHCKDVQCQHFWWFCDAGKGCDAHSPKDQTQEKRSRQTSVPWKKGSSKRAFGSLTPGVHSSVSHGVTHTHIGQTGRFGVERSETLEGIWTWFTQSC